MAIEEIEEIPAPPKKKSGALKWIIISVVILVLLLGMLVGGVVLYTKLAPSLGLPALFGTNASKGKKEIKKEDVDQIGVMYAMPSFVVNLAKSTGERFIKITMQFELADEQMREEITSRLPQIQDHIITVLSSTTLKEAVTSEGKFRLKEEILTRINQILQSGSVKNIYFTEFIVQ